MVVKEFVEDLKRKKIDDTEIINKYFKFKTTKQSDKDSVVFPIITKLLDALRLKLNQECEKMEILRHDNSDMIKSYKLDSKDLELNNVYYIICNGKIVTPVLLDGDRILSASVVIKSENWPKSFIIF